jgi:hypothetical protein
MEAPLLPGEAVLPRLTSFVTSLALLYTLDFTGNTDGDAYKVAQDEWTWLGKCLWEDQINGAFTETSTS